MYNLGFPFFKIDLSDKLSQDPRNR